MILELLATASAAYAPMSDWHTGQPCPIPEKSFVAPKPGEYRKPVYSVADMLNVSPAVFERCLELRYAAIERERRALVRKSAKRR